MKRALLCVALLSPFAAFAQQEAPVEVCDLVLVLKSNEMRELYYGFAAGDRISFSFEETSGQALKSVEIWEYPEQLRFQEAATASIKDKILAVSSSKVYRFVFHNDRKDKTCKILIRRIPASAKTKNFQTAVRWVEQYDTTYLKDKPARIELQTVERRVQKLVKTDTVVVNLVDKKERVASRGNLSQEASSFVKVALPQNYREGDRSYEVVSWAYWLGVGQDAEGQYAEANRLAKLAKTATNAVKSLGVLAGPYGALASLAVDGVSFFLPSGSGDNIQYEIRCKDKVVDTGNGPAAYARQQDCTQGEIRFKLTNDNLIESVDVSLRVMAVAVAKTFKEEIVIETKEVPVLEKQISLKKVPLLAKE